jgi:putative transposase
MQKLGRSYVGQFNARHRRTGTLWEGRHKVSLVDSESHVLHCHRYIELNPVRARMTDDPTAYPWSSCASHCGLRQEAILSPHPEYTRSPPHRKRAPRPTASCYTKPRPTTTCKPSEPTFNNNAPWVAMTSVRWPNPRPDASPVSGPRTARLTTIQTVVSEPDPVFEPN